MSLIVMEELYACMCIINGYDVFKLSSLNYCFLTLEMILKYTTLCSLHMNASAFLIIK